MKLLSPIQLSVWIAVAIAGVSQSAASAATIAVTNPMPADRDVADGTCTLREAIIAANSRAAYHGCAAGGSGTNTIRLPAGSYALTTELPTVQSNVHVVGSGYARTTINGSGRAGMRFAGVDDALTDVTIRQFIGSAVTVMAGADVTMSAVSFVDNGEATSQGTDIHNSGTTRVWSGSFTTAVFSFNSLIRNEASGSISLVNVSLFNSASEHSIIYNAGGSVGLFNATVGGNTDTASGVIHNDAPGTLSISFSTIAFNTAKLKRGSAILNSGGTVDVQGSIILGLPGGGPTCAGTINSGGYNVFDAASPCAPLAAGDTVTSTPNLDTSGSKLLPKPHGGIGPVYLPLAGSPAIGRVDPSFCGNVDARGGGRPQWPLNCASGAVDVAEAWVVVGNVNALTAGDRNIVTQLQGIFDSSRVRIISDATTAGPALGAIVLSGSVSDARVTTHYRNMTGGVVVLKPSLFDEMNMTNSSATTSEGTTTANALNILATDFFNSGSRAGFTSGGYASGNDPVLTTSSVSYGWGAAGGFADADAAIRGASTHFGIFRYAPGETMFHSFVAPGNRVGFFATDAAAAVLTTAGNRLLQEAVLVGSLPKVP